MKVEDEKITFSTGKVARVNCGIIGLGPDGGVYEGYDDAIHNDGWQKLTDAELVELASYMMEKWLKVNLDAWCRHSKD